jgi:CDGSH-type Zn-finger protein
LTTKGRKLISGTFPRHAAKIIEEMGVLSSAEQETLGNLCRKLGLRQRRKKELRSINKTKEESMSKKLPVLVELEPGTYYWCSCGKSKKEPFCDGSHKDTALVPVEFVMNAKKKVALCTCQRTKKAPYCDGTHAKVD